MIIGMGVGNLNGNYDVREIFNSAIFGYIDFLNKAIQVNIFSLALSNWKLVVPFALIGLLAPLISKNRERIKQYSAEYKDKLSGALKYIGGSYWLSLIVGTLLGTVFNIISALFSFLIFFLLGVAILPALIGYLSGEANIRSIKGSPVCVGVTKSILKNKYTNQCTQITIKGKRVMGDVLLETGKGYFMHTDKSFLFLSKDKEICIYSKYEKSDVVSAAEDFEFEASQIDDICAALKNVKG